MNFITNWAVPSREDLEAIVSRRFKDDIKVNPDLILEAAAGVSQKMFGGTLKDAYPDGVPLAMEFMLGIPLKGDILNRSIAIAKIIGEAGGKKSLERMIKTSNEDEFKKYLEALMNGEGEDEESDEGEDEDDWMKGLHPGIQHMTTREEILEKMKQIEQMPQFQDLHSMHLKENDFGEEVRDLTVTDVSQMSKLRAQDIAMDFEVLMMMFSTGMLTYQQRYSFEQEEFNIVVRIDDSGSMNHGYKLVWVVATLRVLFKRVEYGSIIYVGSFEMRGGPVTRISTKAEADAYLRSFRGGYGGDTNIGEVIKTDVKAIKAGQIGAFPLERPGTQLFIINDGQDPINPGDPELENLPVKVHVLTLMEANYELASVCKNSGGHAFAVDMMGELEEYGTTELSGTYERDDEYPHI